MLAARHQAAAALEGFGVWSTPNFGIVGTFSKASSPAAQGFSGIQIAPSWIVTAAHVAPTVDSFFTNHYGAAAVAGIVRAQTTAPSDSPLPGAPRDDLALVRLTSPIAAPYLPRLLDDEMLMHRRANPDACTLVSNNPGLSHRYAGFARVQALIRREGYEFVLAEGDGVNLVSGDSGSAMFLGFLRHASVEAVLFGVASARTVDKKGQNIGVYARVGAHRKMMDEAMAGSGQRLSWLT